MKYQGCVRGQGYGLFGAVIALSVIATNAVADTVKDGTSPRNLSQLDSEAGSGLQRNGDSTLAKHGELPLMFEPNHGQVDEPVRFLSRQSGYQVYLTPTEAVIVMALGQLVGDASAGAAPLMPPGSGRNKTSAGGVSSGWQRVASVLRMRFLGANRDPKISGLDTLAGKVNYLRGQETTPVTASVPTYGSVKYEDLYPGIDLIYYGNQGKLEYDFVVAPGVDPDLIGLRFEGSQSVEVDEQGNLVLETAAGKLLQRKPVIYQKRGNRREPVDGHYVLDSESRPDTVGFQIAEYDKSRALIIDPVVVYSTYIGGNLDEVGSPNSRNSIAIDTERNVYITGATRSLNFPTSAGAIKLSPGNVDAYITKIDPSGTSLIYSTYFGGRNFDSGEQIAADDSGSAYVVGRTNSPGLATPGSFQTQVRGGDAFVVKLNQAGELVYSTYLGGSAGEGAFAIDADAEGNAYVTGTTRSNDFPVTNGRPLRGVGDAFVVKLGPAGDRALYATYLGGSDDQDIPDEGPESRTPTGENGLAIAVDAAGNAHVAGQTNSQNFPITPVTVQRTFAGAGPNGNGDAFVARFNPVGELIYSTYLGGSADDQAYGVDVDNTGNTYVAGFTASDDFTVQDALQPDYSGGTDAFIARINSDGGLEYSTYFGGDTFNTANDIAVTQGGVAYITGTTDSQGFFPVNPNATQFERGGEREAFLATLSSTGAPHTRLRFSTFIGGSGAESGDGVATDGLGNAYVIGKTQSSDFPTKGAGQPRLRGGVDSFVTKIFTDALPPAFGGESPSDGAPISTKARSEVQAQSASTRR